jgi:phenylacetate-coenzyme A ligase PaaK-like adenylate-forming protein
MFLRPHPDQDEEGLWPLGRHADHQRGERVPQPDRVHPLEVPEVAPQYVLIIRKKGYLDALSVDVEAKPEVYEMGEEKLKAVEQEIESRIRGTVGIGVKVRCVPPKAIERSEGKAKRVYDARNM